MPHVSLHQHSIKDVLAYGPFSLLSNQYLPLIFLLARFNLDQLNKKSNAIQKDIGMKMKVLATAGMESQEIIKSIFSVQEQRKADSNTIGYPVYFVTNGQLEKGGCLGAHPGSC